MKVSLPHRRSPAGWFKQKVRRFIFRFAHVDYDKGEKVNKISHNALRGYCYAIAPRNVSWMPQVPAGAVLQDPRGDNWPIFSETTSVEEVTAQ